MRKPVFGGGGGGGGGSTRFATNRAVQLQKMTTIMIYHQRQSWVLLAFSHRQLVPKME